jgi:hypothetical protein
MTTGLRETNDKVRRKNEKNKETSGVTQSHGGRGREKGTGVEECNGI